MKRTNGISHVSNEKHILICTAEATLAGERLTSQNLKESIDLRKTDPRPHGHSVGEATVRRLIKGLIGQDLIEFEWGLAGDTHLYTPAPRAVRYYWASESGIDVAKDYLQLETLGSLDTSSHVPSNESFLKLVGTTLGREVLKRAL